MKLKMSKCEFLREQIQFLGHVVSASGCTADPEKVSAIRDLCPPTSVKDVRGFIGLCSYYRRYVPAFSEVAQPLIKLTRKNAKFVWSDEFQLAFDQLKTLLTEAPVLAHADINRPYKLYTDASLNCVGAILTQDGPDGQEHVIHYLSQQLSPTARRWSVIEKECFAVVTALKKFRQYLLGSRRELAASAGRSLCGGPQVAALVAMAGFSSLPADKSLGGQGESCLVPAA